MPCTSRSSYFEHPGNIWWGVHVMKLLITQFPPVLFYIDPRGPKCLSQHPISWTPLAYVLPSMWDTKFYNHVTWTGKITVPCALIYMESKREDTIYGPYDSGHSSSSVCFCLRERSFDFLGSSPDICTFSHIQRMYCLYIYIILSCILFRRQEHTECSQHILPTQSHYYWLIKLLFFSLFVWMFSTRKLRSST